MKAKLMVLVSPAWTDVGRTKNVLDNLSSKFTEVIVVTRAKTQDVMAEAWAFSWYHTVRRHHLDTDKHGKNTAEGRLADMVAESTHLVLLGKPDAEMKAAKQLFSKKTKPKIKEFI